MQQPVRPRITPDSPLQLIVAASLICLISLLLAACTSDEGEHEPGQTSAETTPAATGDDERQQPREDTEPAAEEPEPPVIDDEEDTVYFPRQAPFDEPVEVLTIDSRGPIALDDRGCLRLGDESGDVIIWPPTGFKIDIVDGEVTLIDEYLDLPIATAGEWIDIGGERGFSRPRGVPEGSREAVESAMDHPLPAACADADGYVFPGGEAGGGIQRIEPEPELAEIMGWDWEE